MSDEEKIQVEDISWFIAILYVKAWFQSPLPTAAARNDLAFMMKIMKYRLVTKPRIAMDILQSCYRHLWYLVPQTVVLALADQGLGSSQKERMAVKLHSLERNTIVGGKPTFPYIDLSNPDDIPDLASLVSSESWLLFNLLELNGSQDWMTIPSKLCDNYVVFKNSKSFRKIS